MTPQYSGSKPPLEASQEKPPSAIEAMVTRFLGWKLPDDFEPDCGINFDGRSKEAEGYEKTWPSGTNLFTAEQARTMLEYVLGGSLQQGSREGLTDRDIDSLWLCHSLMERPERGNARTFAMARDFARDIEQQLAAKWGITLSDKD